MKTGLAQIQCTLGDPPTNCALIAEYAARARAAGCDLVVFPELTDTGYELEAIKKHASTWKGLPYLTASKAASHERLFVAIGLTEKDGDTIYNSLAAFGPDGELIGKYRKCHLFNHGPVKEGDVLSRGDNLVVVNLGGMQCGLMICYDLRFPEIARALALKGAEALIVASAWPFPRVDHLATLLRARAIENQVFVLGANRVGTDGALTFCGSSHIFDPYGVTVGSGAVDRSQLVLGTLQRETFEWTRNRMPVLKDRRPEVYGT